MGHVGNSACYKRRIHFMLLGNPLQLRGIPGVFSVPLIRHTHALVISISMASSLAKCDCHPNSFQNFNLYTVLWSQLHIAVLSYHLRQDIIGARKTACGKTSTDPDEVIALALENRLPHRSTVNPHSVRRKLRPKSRTAYSRDLRYGERKSAAVSSS